MPRTVSTATHADRCTDAAHAASAQVMTDAGTNEAKVRDRTAPPCTHAHLTRPGAASSHAYVVRPGTRNAGGECAAHARAPRGEALISGLRWYVLESHSIAPKEGLHPHLGKDRSGGPPRSRELSARAQVCPDRTAVGSISCDLQHRLPDTAESVASTRTRSKSLCWTGGIQSATLRGQVHHATPWSEVPEQLSEIAAPWTSSVRLDLLVERQISAPLPMERLAGEQRTAPSMPDR